MLTSKAFALFNQTWFRDFFNNPLNSRLKLPVSFVKKNILNIKSLETFLTNKIQKMGLRFVFKFEGISHRVIKRRGEA